MRIVNFDLLHIGYFGVKSAPPGRLNRTLYPCPRTPFSMKRHGWTRTDIWGSFLILLNHAWHISATLCNHKARLSKLCLSTFYEWSILVKDHQTHQIITRRNLGPKSSGSVRHPKIGSFYDTLWLWVTNSLPWYRWPIEIDGLAIKYGDFPWRTVKKPDGNIW